MIADLTGKTSGLTLSDSAQIVTGISGNAVYLPDYAYGYVQLSGTHVALSLAFWRLWDGIVNAGAMRSVIGCGTDFYVEFDPADNYLNVKLPGLAVQKLTLMDDEINHHWAITYEQNLACTIYIDGTAVSTLTAPDAPIDFTPEVFCIGSPTGGAHATFDELRMYNSVLKKSDIDGLVQLISKGYLASSMQAVVISTTPKYAGTVQDVPTLPAVVIIKGPVIGNVTVNQGDWVLMTASGTTWTQGSCYLWTGTAWLELDAAKNPKEYQDAMFDILSITELMANTGHYGALFIKLLMAQTAMIDELNTRIVHLQSTGKIHSGAGNYGNVDTPAYLGADGKFSLGSKLKFDGTNLDVTGVVHASSGEFTGAVHASSGEFTGTVNASGGTFSGLILSLLGFKMQGSTGTSCIINKTGMVIYSRVGADTNPVYGDRKIVIDADSFDSWFYNGGWQSTYGSSYGGYSRIIRGFSIASCQGIDAGLFKTSQVSLIASSSYQDALSGAGFDYAYGACVTGWILLPQTSTLLGLGVYFKGICYGAGYGKFSFNVIVNTNDSYNYQNYIQVTGGKLMVKNLGMTGKLVYMKSGYM